MERLSKMEKELETIKNNRYIVSGGLLLEMIASSNSMYKKINSQTDLCIMKIGVLPMFKNLLRKKCFTKLEKRKNA